MRGREVEQDNVFSKNRTARATTPEAGMYVKVASVKVGLLTHSFHLNASTQINWRRMQSFVFESCTSEELKQTSSPPPVRNQ